MSFQAYLDTIKAKTGLGPEDFIRLAVAKGLHAQSKAADVVSWLKADYALGHGHAMALFAVLKSTGQPRKSTDDRIAAHFSGKRARWRPAFEAWLTKVTGGAADLQLAPTDSYISINRGSKKIGVVVIGVDHVDVGLKCAALPTDKRLSSAEGWNAMVSHRVRLVTERDFDARLVAWMQQAYAEAASTGAAKKAAPKKAVAKEVATKSTSSNGGVAKKSAAKKTAAKKTSRS